MKQLAISSLALALAGTVMAAERVPHPDAVECLPNEENRVVTARVDGLEGGDSVRSYFRRLNPTGAFYFVAMEPAGDGLYWTTLPRPEDRRQQQLTDEWWEILEDRDWVGGRSRDEIEDWLEDQEHEAAEWFVAVYDMNGNRVGRTPDLVVEVWDAENCDNPLTPMERGLARNLTVGETTEAQIGHPVFHWLCDGVVTRLSYQDILRGDEFCRSCVVAAWFPLAVAAAAPTVGITINKREPKRPSDVEP